MQALRMVSQSNGARGAAHRLLTGYGALTARNLPFTALQFPIFEAIRRRLWERRDRRAGDDRMAVQKDGSGGVGGGERRIVEKGAAIVARGLMETGLVNGTSAAVSGAIAAVITTPTDVVKTRMMLSAGEGDRPMQGAAANNEQRQRQQQQPCNGRLDIQRETPVKQRTSSSPQPDGPARRQNMNGLQVARLVYQERGLQGLFRGGLLRASWTAVGSGLYLGTYEMAKVWLKGTDDGQDADL